MKILIVDDEERLARTIGRGLTAEGFEVTLAHDGITGEHFAQTQEFAAIVLDIMLPGRNGYEVCANLRAHNIDTPILMLTAKDGELDEAEALDTGADDYLSKPFHFVVLVARLRALIRRSAPPPRQDVTYGNIRIVPTEHVALRDGVPVDLTAKEFGILEYLSRHPGAVVSKQELIDELWDFAAPPDANAVEVHVSSLRRKLGSPIVHTVRGLGYQLREPTP